MNVGNSIQAVWFSVQSAGIGGAAHLVNFYGTDTLAAIMMARKYYGEEMAANSIPAAEHRCNICICLLVCLYECMCKDTILRNVIL